MCLIIAGDTCQGWQAKGMGFFFGQNGKKSKNKKKTGCGMILFFMTVVVFSMLEIIYMKDTNIKSIEDFRSMTENSVDSAGNNFFWLILLTHFICCDFCSLSYFSCLTLVFCSYRSICLYIFPSFLFTVK